MTVIAQAVIAAYIVVAMLGYVLLTVCANKLMLYLQTKLNIGIK